ncbi:hypothetical protein C8Q74DRAFT_568991 [Fomes fomentarius]|nr:hypothetical protein C8Q74DRAFT_568991 [Fomes fomentarius]
MLTRSSCKRLKTADESDAHGTHCGASCQALNNVSQSEEIAQGRRRRRRVLQVLEFPVDIFLQICIHLRPQDLLALIRVCKQFRKTLLNLKMTEQTIWMAARDNVDTIMLPARPAFISEPELVKFLYSSNCDHCGVNGERRWVWIATYCGQCFPRVCVSFRTLVRLLFAEYMMV